MSRDIVIIKLDDRERWTAEHRIDGLPSQSWNYAWGLSAAGLEPQLAVVRAGGARMLLPFVERQWLNSVDIATILGMSGASIVPPSSSAPLLLWQEYAKSRGWISGYIQLAVTVDFEPEANIGTLAANNTTFILGLDTDIAVSASRSIRQKIKGALNRGIGLESDANLLLQCLQRLHPETMRRVGAGWHYCYPAQALERWLCDPAALAIGARTQDGIEAVYLFRIAGSRAEAHIAASTEKSRDLLPWLVWHGIRRMRERSVATLDLGGSPQTGDGLYRFKERFGGIPKTIKAVHQIYDRTRYRELCRIAGIAETGRWFPSYRSGPDDKPSAQTEPAGSSRQPRSSSANC